MNVCNKNVLHTTLQLYWKPATQVGVNCTVVCVPKDSNTEHAVANGRAYLLRWVHVVNGALHINNFLSLVPC